MRKPSAGAWDFRVDYAPESTAGQFISRLEKRRKDDGENGKNQEDDVNHRIALVFASSSTFRWKA